MTTRQAFPHGSPEHWQARYRFRADHGYDIETVLEPEDYVVAQADDGTPTLSLGIRAYLRLRETCTDPGDLAHLDQLIALLSDTNQQIRQEVRHA